MAYNIQHKLSDNIAAIKIALQHGEGFKPTDSELEVLQRYSGFGGIKTVMLPYGPLEAWLEKEASQQDVELYPSIMELHDVLQFHFTKLEYKQVFESLKNSVLSSFYTPSFVPRTLFEQLKVQGITPQRLYEPSSGAGAFIREALYQYPSIEKITAVEKDILTGKVLQTIGNSMFPQAEVLIRGFEETSEDEKGKYDIIASNIPFGNFRVFDRNLSHPYLTSKIHNYFFGKGLSKIADGGLLAFITTDGFLNSPSNETVRQYLFQQSNFVSLTVLPDNLMKETGNTQAPNHLLIVQKNETKTKLTAEEETLLTTVLRESPFGPYSINAYIDENPNVIIGDVVEPGQNQYGKAHLRIQQSGDIEKAAKPLEENLKSDYTQRLQKDRFSRLAQSFTPQPSAVVAKRQLKYLPVPAPKEESVPLQLGLFDTVPTENINRAMDYLNPPDFTVVERQSARIIGTIKTAERPEHESLVLVTAKARTNNNYYYKLFSNLEGIEVSGKWVNGERLQEELNVLQQAVSDYGVEFRLYGENKFSFGTDESSGHDLLFSDLKPHFKEGTLVLFNGQPGTIHQVDFDNGQSIFQPFSLNIRTSGFYHDYIHIRDSYFELATKEQELGVEQKELRTALNLAYDRFLIHHGTLNQPSNKKVLLNDSLGFVTLCSLERKEGEQYFRSDLFTNPLFKEDKVFKTDNPLEALARCLNEKGAVDISFIAEAIDQSDEDAIGLLTDHIYLNPKTETWETSDKYLSGNVVLKMEEAEAGVFNNPGNPFFQKSLEAITAVQPERITFELLDFNLGERWMPTKFYDQFASILFDQEVSVIYLPSIDVFQVSAEKENAKITTEHAVTGKSGRTLKGTAILQHALENTNPYISYEIIVDGEKVRVPDNEAIQLAHQKIEAIRQKYIDWLRQRSTEDKDEIEKTYNNKFNCYVLREYDGTHLQFPDLDKTNLGITDLYSSQKNAAWRVIQQRGGLIDHEVGLGKTLTMIIACYEMKRLGIVHKPMIIGLKANTKDIAVTFRKAYPNARLLAPSDDDFNPANRKRLFHSIKNNNWDCIIITHDQFGKILQSPEIQMKILQEEIDNVERDLETMKAQGGSVSKAILKGLEIRKNNLAANLKEVLLRIEEKKDAEINFIDMGVDHLFVDEAHKFKNLTFTTRHNRVAGLGNVEGSQRALNMLFAVRTLQEKFGSDLNATFLSGTPISNSLTELYLIFKYLRPREMERQQIENFDAWAAVFAKKTVDFEFSVTNEIISKERFRHFIKVPELALFYNEITDYKTAAHIKLDKPDMEEILVNIPPSPDQEVFIQNLIQFARTGDGELIGREKLTPEEDKGRMLIATNYAKKMAVDLRLIDPIKYSDHPQNKTTICARKVAEIYHESKEYSGTQIVFCDIGTPKANEFNIYDELKDKLVRQYNVRPNEVAFIHDWETKKQQLFKLMNAGRIRVLVGSTEKAGTGLNVQERVVATHHIDIPWTPKDLEQRNGRAARQGNVIAKNFYGNKVKNFIYATERSLDNYKFNLLKNKITFISQMKNGELHLRTIDEGAFDKQSGMNFSEYVAILSGDDSLLQKAKLEKRVAALENLRVIHYKQQRDNKYQLLHKQTEKETLTTTVAKLTRDNELYHNQLAYNKDGSKCNPIVLDNCVSADPTAIGKYIIDLYKQWKPSAQPIQKIGTLYGFDLFIEQGKSMYNDEGRLAYRYDNKLFAQHGEDGVKFTFNNGQPNIESPALAARYFINAIDRVSKLLEQYAKQLDDVSKDVLVLAGLQEQPFEREDELKQLKADLSVLEMEIAAKIKPIQVEQSSGEEESLVIDIKDGKKKIQKSSLMRTAC